MKIILSLKKRMSLLMLFSLFILNLVTIDSIAQSKSTLKYDKALGFLKNTYPDGYEILNKVDAQIVGVYIDGTKDEDVLSNLGTAVHESCHMLNFKIGGFHHEGYFVQKGIEIEVVPRGVYRSSKANYLIPKPMKKTSQRFEVYMKESKGNEHLTSLQDGIYGLLNEFTAYCHDMDTELALIDAGYLGDQMDWITNMTESYYEFNVFMASYLKHLKKSNTKDYNLVVKNSNLIVVYTLVEKRFRDVIKRIDSDATLKEHYSQDMKVYFTTELKSEIGVIFNNEITFENWEDYLEENLVLNSSE